MLKRVDNFEVTSREDFYDFMQSAIKGFAQEQILKLTVEDMICIYKCDFKSVEEFALFLFKIKKRIEISLFFFIYYLDFILFTTSSSFIPLEALTKITSPSFIKSSKDDNKAFLSI